MDWIVFDDNSDGGGDGGDSDDDPLAMTFTVTQRERVLADESGQDDVSGGMFLNIN